MKKYSFFATLLLFFLGNLSAQTIQHNFEESIALAKDQEKDVLMIFSGSDWCKPCMQLKQAILTQPEFIAFSENNLILLELDFPYRRKNRLPKEQRKYNEQLAEKYNQEGSFPKILLFDAEANKVGDITFHPYHSPKEFIYQIEQLRDRYYSQVTK